MGIEVLAKNFDKAMGAINRQTVMRGLLGQPAKGVNEAALHDIIDLIPGLGDISSFRRIMTNKGNRMNQTVDAVVGAIPILGDIVDLLATSTTNIDQITENKIKEMGPLETILTAKFIDNAIERYIGGNAARKIWTD